MVAVAHSEVAVAYCLAKEVGKIIGLYEENIHWLKRFFYFFGENPYVKVTSSMFLCQGVLYILLTTELI